MWRSQTPARALLILQDWAYLFLLIAPLDPAETEPLNAFRRVGVLVVFTETPTGHHGAREEELVLLLSPGREDGKSR